MTRCERLDVRYKRILGIGLGVSRLAHGAVLGLGHLDGQAGSRRLAVAVTGHRLPITGYLPLGCSTLQEANA
jgi:hypothetical protein